MAEALLRRFQLVIALSKARHSGLTDITSHYTPTVRAVSRRMAGSWGLRYNWE